MANRFDPSDTLVSANESPSHVRVRAAIVAMDGDPPMPPPVSSGVAESRPPSVRAPAGAARAARFALPLGLAFVGGALGGLLGGGAMALHVQIASASSPSWIKMLAVTWGATAVFVVALWRVRVGLNASDEKNDGRCDRNGSLAPIQR